MLYLFAILPIVIFLFVLYCLKQPVTLDVLLLVVLLVFMCSITWAPDMDNYMASYYGGDARYRINRGFTSVNIFLANKGFSFYEFYMIFHAVCLLLIFVSIRLIVNDSLKCIVLYIFAPFIMNVIQLKNFGMMSLMLLAFSVCHRMGNNYRRICVWIVLISLAASFHIVGYAYLPFVFFLGKRKLLEKFPIIMFGITVFFIFANDALQFLLQPLLTFAVDNVYKSLKYAQKATSFGGFYFMLQSLLMIYIVNKIRIVYSVYKKLIFRKIFLYECDYGFPEQVYDFTLYSSLFWPLFVASAHYSRLIENQLVLVYILVVSFFTMYTGLRNLIDKTILNDFMIKILASFFLLMLVYFHSIWMSHWENIIFGILGNLEFLYVFYN